MSNFGNKKSNVYTRCACCDIPLGETQPINRTTGEVDDLCKVCRDSVDRAKYFHEDDSVDMYILEKFGWRIQLDGSSYSEDVERDYNGGTLGRDGH